MDEKPAVIFFLLDRYPKASLTTRGSSAPTLPISIINHNNRALKWVVWLATWRS